MYAVRGAERDVRGGAEMKNWIRTMLFAAVISCLCVGTAFAGQWEQDETGYRCRLEDGSLAVNCWQWLDGNSDGVAECYYFDEAGYCLIDTMTPDGSIVDGNGAWIVDGVVQTMILESSGGEASQQTKAAEASEASWSGNYPYVAGMTAEKPDSYNYVVNINTGKIHKPGCSSVADMKQANTRYFAGGIGELTAAGYTSCGRCRAK